MLDRRDSIVTATGFYDRGGSVNLVRNSHNTHCDPISVGVQLMRTAKKRKPMPLETLLTRARFGYFWPATEELDYVYAFSSDPQSTPFLFADSRERVLEVAEKKYGFNPGSSTHIHEYPQEGIFRLAIPKR